MLKLARRKFRTVVVQLCALIVMVPGETAVIVPGFTSGGEALETLAMDVLLDQISGIIGDPEYAPH